MRIGNIGSIGIAAADLNDRAAGSCNVQERPAQPREIPLFVEELDHLVDQIGERLGELNGRLTMVMADLPPAGKNANGTGPGPGVTPVGMAIARIAANLELIRCRLEAIDRALEL
jgi:hypothetical protein